MTDSGLDFCYTYEHDVRFEETDAQGVVFFGNYVTFFDEAILAYWADIGYPYEAVLEAGWEVFVVHVDLDYHASARFGDRLRHGVRVAKLGTSSITFDYRCERADDGELLATGSATQVAVDEAGDSMPLPDSIRDAIDDYQAVPPESA